ncbi:MAG: GLUG motif-containing protein, partial [Candidatus Cloacimonetes bacterium]|nr:GLUG motif-containing protein [Candidatus Cloacimonadota bacterium]
MSAKTADALAGTVVNNSGIIQAKSITSKNGVIILDGGTSGVVVNSGILDASGKDSGQIGGTVKALGETVHLASGTRIDVSGDAGGGNVLIGGAYQGGNSEYAATTTTVASGAMIAADGITRGNGGKVVVWANGTTNFEGTITARGGSVSGNGGSVETSGKQTLILADTARVNTTAAKGATGTWLLDPADFTIGDTDGLNSISASTLHTALENSNVTIATSSSNNTIVSTMVNNSNDTSDNLENGDIIVNRDLTWASAYMLTLSAYNNIILNSSIIAPKGGLTLTANTSNSGDGITSGIITPSRTSNLNVGVFTLTNGTWGEIDSTLSGFLAADFRISGGTFLRALGGDGNIDGGTPYQIADVYGLQGIGSNGMLGNCYILANNIDASGTANWNGGAGFVPIGIGGTLEDGNFTGRFDGNGKVIKNLTIYLPNRQFVGLFGATFNYQPTEIPSIQNIGLENVNIVGNQYVGGLVGQSDGSGIANSYSTGVVTGVAGFAGGLVGFNYRDIKNCYSTGTVRGSDHIGGLVGHNFDNGNINTSYSTSTVIGLGSPSIGGLVGENAGVIVSSYSTGTVSGNQAVGGLVGKNYGAIINSYSIGTVNGSQTVGGLVGENYGPIVSSYWNTDIAPLGVGNNSTNTTSGVTGLTTGQMMQSANYSTDWWTIDTDGSNSAANWRIYEGRSYPLLKAFLTPLTVTAGGPTVYSGTTSIPVTYSTTPNSSLLMGNLTYTLADSFGTTVNSAVNVGTYEVTGVAGLYSTQQGYDITYASNTLIINPLALTASQISTVSKTYDRSTSATFGDNAIHLSGVLSGDSVSVSGTGTYASPNAGTSTVSVDNVTISNSNYSLAVSDVAGGRLNGQINPLALTALQTSPMTKTYDGDGSNVIFAGNTIHLSGVLNGDSVSVIGTGTYTNPNVGPSAVLVSSVTLNNGNYSLAVSDVAGGMLNGQINPKPLQYSVGDVTSVYGTLAKVGTATLNGVLPNDIPLVSGTVGIEDSAGRAVTLAANTQVGKYSEKVNSLTGLAAGNYILSTSDNSPGMLIINPIIAPVPMVAAITSAVTGVRPGTIPIVSPVSNIGGSSGIFGLNIVSGGVNMDALEGAMYPGLRPPTPPTPTVGPGRPEPGRPGSSEVVGPSRPGPGRPGTPEVVGPSRPEPGRPGTPEVVGPSRPEPGRPGTPEVV